MSICRRLNRLFVPHVVIILMLISGTFACTSTGNNESPTAPSPTPTPAPPAAPAPPTTRTITFTPDTSTPIGKAIAIFVASDPAGYRDGMISLAITAHNLTNVYSVRAGLRWDDSIFGSDGLGAGEFLKQGGVQVTCCVAGMTEPGREIQVLRVDRPTSAAAVSGSGEMILVRLRPREGAPAGTYPLRFDTLSFLPGAFVSGDGPNKNVRWPHDNLYAGTLTLQ